MYLRNVRKEELVAWLLEKGFAEEKSGFGHVDAETLAGELLSKFEMLIYSKQAL